MIVSGSCILVASSNLGVAGVGHAVGGDDRINARQLGRKIQGYQKKEIHNFQDQEFGSKDISLWETQGNTGLSLFEVCD